jgi:hypothetical protein
VKSKDTAPNRIAVCCDVLAIRFIKDSAPCTCGSAASLWNYGRDFAHLDVCSTIDAKMPQSRYQFPCNHLRWKVSNQVQYKMVKKGNFYLPVRNLLPELNFS